MLESIRKRSNSIIIAVIFGVIILVFIFWGVGPTDRNDSERSVVATVDGVSISVKEYAELYKRQAEYYRNTFKGQFTDELARKMDLKHRSIDTLINRTLAFKEAKREGIKASEEDVQNAIKSMQVFSKNGAFDRDIYFRVLSANRMKPAEFEKSVEEDLVTSRMRDKAVKDVTVTDNEVKEAYQKENKKVNFEFISLDGSLFKDLVRVTDDEAKEYLKKNASAFMVPAKIKAFYAYADFNRMARGIKLTEAEVKEFYDKNPGQFATQEEARARHILIMPDKLASDKVKAREQAREKASELLKRIKGGANFSGLAKASSQDPGSARQGGELGWFPRGIMVKSFEEAVFSLKKGEISGLVETEFGYHIIQLEERKEAGKTPFKEAMPEIKKILALQKAQLSAREAFKTIEKPVRDAASADALKAAVSSQKDIKTNITPLFSEDDKKVELAANEALREAAFALKAGETTRVIETHEGIYMIKALERVEARVPDYGEVSSKIKEKLISEKADGEAERKAGDILKRLKAGEDFSGLAGKDKYKVTETGDFTKAQGFMQKIGAFTGDKEKLFELTAASPYYPEILVNNGRYYVLKLKGVKEADESGFDARKDELRARLLSSKQDEALDKWLKGLREKAKIKVYEEKL